MSCDKNITNYFLELIPEEYLNFCKTEPSDETKLRVMKFMHDDDIFVNFICTEAIPPCVDQHQFKAFILVYIQVCKILGCGNCDNPFKHMDIKYFNGDVHRHCNECHDKFYEYLRKVGSLREISPINKLKDLF